MTDSEMFEIVHQWVRERKQIRKRLIALAREANPHSAQVVGNTEAGWTSTDHRKLWQFPSDLSEERLLNLIGHYTMRISE